MENNNLNKQKNLKIIAACIGVFLLLAATIFVLLTAFKNDKEDKKQKAAIGMGEDSSFSVTNTDDSLSKGGDISASSPAKNVYDIEYISKTIEVEWWDNAEDYCVDADGNNILFFKKGDDYKNIFYTIDDNVVNPPDSTRILCLVEPIYKDVIDYFEQIDFDKYYAVAYYDWNGSPIPYDVQNVTIEQAVTDPTTDIFAVPYLNIEYTDYDENTPADQVMSARWTVILLEKNQYEKYFGTERPLSIKEEFADRQIDITDTDTSVSMPNQPVAGNSIGITMEVELDTERQNDIGAKMYYGTLHNNSGRTVYYYSHNYIIQKLSGENEWNTVINNMKSTKMSACNMVYDGQDGEGINFTLMPEEYQYTDGEYRIVKDIYFYNIADPEAATNEPPVPISAYFTIGSETQNDVEDVEMEIYVPNSSENSNKPNSKFYNNPDVIAPDYVKATINNNSIYEITFDYYYSIEKQLDNGVWEIVPLDFAVIDLAGILPGGDKNDSLQIDLHPEQYDYTYGKYRVVKNIHYLKGDNSVSEKIYGEFELLPVEN